MIISPKSATMRRTPAMREPRAHRGMFGCSRDATGAGFLAWRKARKSEYRGVFSGFLTGDGDFSCAGSLASIAVVNRRGTRLYLAVELCVTSYLELTKDSSARSVLAALSSSTASYRLSLAITARRIEVNFATGSPRLSASCRSLPRAISGSLSGIAA